MNYINTELVDKSMLYEATTRIRKEVDEHLTHQSRIVNQIADNQQELIRDLQERCIRIEKKLRKQKKSGTSDVSKKLDEAADIMESLVYSIHLLQMENEALKAQNRRLKSQAR